jgi:hypothetical protein
MHVDESAFHESNAPQTRMNNGFQAAMMPSNPCLVINIKQGGASWNVGRKAIPHASDNLIFNRKPLFPSSGTRSVFRQGRLGLSMGGKIFQKPDEFFRTSAAQDQKEDLT